MSLGQQCAFIPVIGAPNVGKSTLVNHLVGQKISAVTPKIHTTRTRITGIAMKDNAQLVFIDTPGIFTPQKRLHQSMIKAAWNSLRESDFILFVIDAKKGISDHTALILKQIKQKKLDVILVINKIDKIAKPALLPLIDTLQKQHEFDDIFMVSALKKDGVDAILDFLGKNAPQNPWMYPENQVLDAPKQVFVAEITREAIFFALDNEVPYGIMVETETIEEKENQIIIHQVIYVGRNAHKEIVIGADGRMIKHIREQAAKQLSTLLGKKLSLYLHVKVKTDWQDRKEYYTAMGLEYIK